jgi:transcriptional regulator GlxA family with amidase domain
MRTIQIAFLIFPKTHLLDLAGAAQVFYEANHLGNTFFKVSFISVEDSVQTEQGLYFSHLQKLEDVSLKARDMVCVPGIDFEGFVAGAINSSIAKTKKWVKEQYDRGVYIGSVCTGSLILAKMGILEGTRCTTHWKCLDYAQKHFPNARFLAERLYVFDRGIFTSAGMTSGIDMSLALIEEWANPLLAAKVAQEMVINIRRAETQSQENTFLDYKNHFNPDVYKAQQILANHLESSYTVKDLALELNLSERQLSRLFQNHTQQTIQDYRDKLRFEFVRQLLYHSELSLKEIAYKCGYKGIRQLTRLWKKFEPDSPFVSRRLFLDNLEI